MTLTNIKNEVMAALAKVFDQQLDPAKLSVTYAADPKFGDIATNAAMVYAKDLGKPPREVAQLLARELQARVSGIAQVEIAGPGFINMSLTNERIAKAAAEAPELLPITYKGMRVVTEYSDPNPFKVLHVGHLYTSVVGEAISNLIRLAGGDVHAVNFGGDVGLHVGRCMWGVLQELGGERPEKLGSIKPDQRALWMAARYVQGATAYEENSQAKDEIVKLNQRVYALHADNDRTSAFAQIYWTLRQWSYDAFDAFYARVGTKFEKYYPESETTPIGLATVREQLAKGVYKESEGAIVFPGEQYGLHTRVFITSKGLPTYEAKDVGLIMSKWRDYKFDESVVITGNDIIEYMKVVLKSIEQFEPELSRRSTHITHGIVKLAGGTKMSSRKGNFLTATDVLDVAAEANRKANGKEDERVTLGAVKYAFLKSRIGSDMVYIPEESVSLEGNSGPYLQYAHARARSILAKAEAVSGAPRDLAPGERLLARKLMEYPDVLQQAVDELMPHYVCTYLYDLAQVFNRFYETNRVLGDERQDQRLALVRIYADVLRNGLKVLGIPAPNRL